jgi:hypothetical protein
MRTRSSTTHLAAGAPAAFLAWIAIVLAAAAMAVGIYSLRVTEEPSRTVIVSAAPESFPNPWAGVDLGELRKSGFTGGLGGVTP